MGKQWWKFIFNRRPHATVRAAKDLAAAFGFEFTNGFALDSNSKGNTYFNLNEKPWWKANSLMEEILQKAYIR